MSKKPMLIRHGRRFGQDGTAGGKSAGDRLYDRILHPTAGRLLQHCDTVLRLPGNSTGAENDVRIARGRGIPVYFDISEFRITRQTRRNPKQKAG